MKPHVRVLLIVYWAAVVVLIPLTTPGSLLVRIAAASACAVLGAAFGRAHVYLELERGRPSEDRAGTYLYGATPLCLLGAVVFRDDTAAGLFLYAGSVAMSTACYWRAEAR